MSVNIKSNPDGVSGAIQVNGVDAFTFDNTGIKTGISGALTGFVTETGSQTLSNKTLSKVILNDGYTEEVYNLTGTVIAASNGSIQTKTLSAATTFTESLTNGQSVLLGITAGSYSVTWPTITWTKIGGGGAAPNLTSTGVNWIVLWKVGGILRGSFLGTA